MEKKLTVFSSAVFGLCLAFYLAGVVFAGGSLVGLVLFWAAFFLCLVESGAFFSRLLLGDRGLLALPLCFCFGAAALYLSFLLFSLFDKPALSLLPCLFLGIYQLSKQWGRGALHLPAPSSALCILLLTAGVFLAAYTLCAVLPFARADRVGNFFYHQICCGLWGTPLPCGLAYPCRICALPVRPFTITI